MLFFLLSVAFARESSQDLLREARKAFTEGDRERTIAITKEIVKNRKVYGTVKDAAHYLLAQAYQEKKSHLLAAEHFQKVHWGGRALSKRALFARAHNLYKGADYKNAIKACRSFQSKWPKSELVDDCFLIMGSASGQKGSLSSMYYYNNEFLTRNEKSPKQESIRVEEAIFAYRQQPQKAKAQLRYLYFNHSYPSSAAQIAQTLLPEDLIPQNLDEHSSQIWSYIRSGFLGEAWQKIEMLQEEAPNDPTVQAWLDENLLNLSWYTRQYDTYIELQKEAYEKSPKGLTAWKIFAGYSRAARWKEAAEWGDQMLKKYRGRGRWAGAKDNVARAHMFQRNYTRAAELWSSLRKNDARFYTAFCQYMAKDYTSAIHSFEKLRKRDDAWSIAAHYWTGRSKEKLKEDPQEHYQYVLENDHIHWYRLLLSQDALVQDPLINLQNGQWLKKELPSPLLDGAIAGDSVQWQAPKKYPQYSRRAAVDWNSQQAAPKPHKGAAPIQKPTHPFYGDQLPNSYKEIPFSTESDLEKLFLNWAHQHKTAFPELIEVYSLALAGDYPIAAYELNKLYERWKEAKPEDPIKGLVANSYDWLSYMTFVRSHHHVMNYTFNQTQLKKLHFPIVHASYLWNIAQDYNVDPLLMHSILRAESTYQEFVISWAGAIGYVQVMPKTGAKVAHLLNEEKYSPKDLEIPRVNLRYGTFYFSRLMERFEQSYPFAVGSYNGGPHNMSRWYTLLKGHVDMAEFVEHIAFTETRLYVKKVCGFYSQYVSHYQNNSGVLLPSPPDQDDASVIDF